MKKLLALVTALLLTVGLAAQTSPQTRHFGALETPNIWQAQQQFLTSPVIPDPTMATHPTTLQYVEQHFSGINHTHLKADITDFPTTWDWANIANKPSTYTPSAHTHVESDITNLTSDLAAKAPLNSPNFTTKITTPQICLNSDCKTAWPSGGDVYLAGNNVFTGTNTFRAVLFGANNAYDLGDSGNTARPRTVYAATSVVAPTINATTSLQIGGSPLSSNNLSDASAVQTRQITFIQGCDTCAAMVDTDDQNDVWINRLGRSVTVQSVFCKSDAGTPTINLLNGASAIVSALSCTSTGATAGSLANTVIANGSSLNYQTATAGGTAKRVTVVVVYK